MEGSLADRAEPAVTGEEVPGLVSIVIPVYNRESMIREAVASARAQTYRPLEIIVVNDGSTDGTSHACREIGSAFPDEVRVVERRNGGPGAARESGRKLARGEFLQYLDSDDWIDPRKIELQVDALRGAPEADVAYCGTREYRQGAEKPEVPARRTGERLSSLFPAILEGRVWATLTPLWRRSFTDRIGPWSELRQEEDIEYDARAGAHGARLAYSEALLADVRHHWGERAGGGAGHDPVRMKARAESHRLVYGHARMAGVTDGSPAMRRYARELFMVARESGAAGLPEESRTLLRLARAAAGSSRGTPADLRIYAAAASVLGSVATARLAGRLERLRALFRGGVE